MLSIRHFATASLTLCISGIAGISAASAQEFSIESLTAKRADSRITGPQFAKTQLKLNASSTRDFDAAEPQGDQVKQGLVQLQQGHFQNAVGIFNSVLNDKPHDSTALAGRALARYELDDVNYALADAAEAIKYDAKCQIAYKVRAIILSDQGDYDGSIEACVSGLHLGTDSELLAILAKDLYSQGDFVHAVAAADNALRLDKSDSLAMNVRGLSDYNMFDNMAAIDDFTQMLQANPNSSISYINRAKSYLQLDRFDLALADLNKSVAINSNDPDAYYLRALVYTALKDKNNALKDTDQLLSMQTTSPTAHRVRGYALEDSGDVQGAAAEYKKAAFLYRRIKDTRGSDEMMSNVIRLQNAIGTAQDTPSAHESD